MTRLIDADALIRKVQYMVEDGERCVEIINIIETAPTIDVVPRSLYEKLLTKHTQTDLISRADAIEAVESANPKDKQYHYYKHIAVDALSALPSAEAKEGDNNER